MTKDSQAPKIWAPTFSVRLEPELAERLRVAAFTHRVKKQPFLRDAMEKLLERESARPATAIRKRWAAIAANQPEETPMRETVRISPEQDEVLRKFCYDFRLHKQTVMRQALIEYLDQVETAARRKR
jgi:predicted transcriptional regulator